MEDFEKLEQSAKETAAEEIVENNGETAEEKVNFINEDDFSPATALGDIPPEAPAKKIKVQTPIIIAAAILLVAILAFACFRIFFNNSVVGTWCVDTGATSDEASETDSNEYYTFEKDGTASITLGTMKVVGTWSYANDDESTTDQVGNKINIAISYFVNGTFDVALEGNAVTGRTMTFNNENMEEPVKFKSVSLPENTLKPDEKFKANDKITGTWKNSDQNQTFTFNEDGTCTLNQMDLMVVDGVYTIDTKNKTIKIKYLRPDENEMEIDYKTSGKDNSKLILLGLEYKKVTE